MIFGVDASLAVGVSNAGDPYCPSIYIMPCDRCDSVVKSHADSCPNSPVSIGLVYGPISALFSALPKTPVSGTLGKRK